MFFMFIYITFIYVYMMLFLFQLFYVVFTLKDFCAFVGGVASP